MWNDFVTTFDLLWLASSHQSAVEIALKFVPFVVFVELPTYLLVTTGMVRFGLRRTRPMRQRENHPSVTCLITCYSEKRDVIKTIMSLAHQEYRGSIEIIPIIDGAIQNAETLNAARECEVLVKSLPGRQLRVLPRWQRGGRVSSLNSGLSIATGEIVMALDGDTSFDNDMVANATRHFDDPNVIGVSGNLRVRNEAHNLATRLQSLEFMLSISGGRTGLSEWNLTNNISGAFGIFRGSFLRHVSGWDAGTAEDLDLTIRLKQYFGRHPNLRIVFEPHAVGHTDCPDSFRGFFKQRLRWDGDLYYLLVRKYRYSMRPKLLGWKTFVFMAINNLFVQILMPFLIVAYTGLLFWTMPIGSALGLLAFVYVAYFVSLVWFFLIYLIAVSERPRHDLRYLLYTPIFPIFAMIYRMHTGASMLSEMLFKSHLESSMAPWWVLKKTKF